jgi:hypothetical protein
LDHDAVALTHLAARAANVVKATSTILRRGWYEGPLGLRRGRSRRRRRHLQRRRSDDRFANRLLRRHGARRLCLPLLRERQRLCSGNRLHLTLVWLRLNLLRRWLYLTLLNRWLNLLRRRLHLTLLRRWLNLRRRLNLTLLR